MLKERYQKLAARKPFHDPVLGLRLRADSNGSTNNAFYLNQPDYASSTEFGLDSDETPRLHNKTNPSRKLIMDVEEGEMTDVVNHNPSVRTSMDRMSKAKSGATTAQEFWKEQQEAMMENPTIFPLMDSTAPGLINSLDTTKDLSLEFSATTADGEKEHRLSSNPNITNNNYEEEDASWRVSEISMGSLLGTGFLDSSEFIRDSWSRQSSNSLSATRIDAKYQPSVAKIHENHSGLGSSAKRSIESSYRKSPFRSPVSQDYFSDDELDNDEFENIIFSEYNDGNLSSWWQRIQRWLNPSPWLVADVKFDSGGKPFFDSVDDWTAAGCVRHHLYNPIFPEFTSLQQFWWAVIIGIVMGAYTAVWRVAVETGIGIVWTRIPELLYDMGIFSDLDGAFPVYHYMWICPMLFGGILSFFVYHYPMPTQNEWIRNLHARGIQDYRGFWTVCLVAVFGLVSGLNLGPELPLILTAGMFGSWLGMACHQSMLQARVLNLTAASAAMSGFFGFPMAGALFVLEIPHRMGLQYFEALSPATVSSVVAVVTNRLILKSDNMTAAHLQYKPPGDFFTVKICSLAIIYGLYGAAIGIFYAAAVMKVHGSIISWLQAPDTSDCESQVNVDDDGSLDYKQCYSPEQTPLVETRTLLEKPSWEQKQRSFAAKKCFWYVRKLCSYPMMLSGPLRAMLGGAFSGGLCGLIAMFVPHTLFWGEEQLQSLLDSGRTPLPVFGQAGDVTADLTSMGFCLIDSANAEAVEAGLSLQCSMLLLVSKAIAIGLSLGTGMIGGHFWGPLFVGCAAGHVLCELLTYVQSIAGVDFNLVSYPNLIVLCTMGAAHVVTFRSHTSIILILTTVMISLSTRDNVESSGSDDLLMVLSSLVVSVFVSLMVSRKKIVFYREQRSRGDIRAVPEVLCEPGLEGRPLVSAYDPTLGKFHGSSGDKDREEVNGLAWDLETNADSLPSDQVPNVETKVNNVNTDLTQEDIEHAFVTQAQGLYGSVGTSVNEESILAVVAPPPTIRRANKEVESSFENGNTSIFSHLDELVSTTATPTPQHGCHGSPTIDPVNTLSRLDELLNAPVDGSPNKSLRISPVAFSKDWSSKRHRRCQSVSAIDYQDSVTANLFQQTSVAQRERSTSHGSGSLIMRVESFGELQEHQPSLMEQARLRAATASGILKTQETHRRPRRTSKSYLDSAEAVPPQSRIPEVTSSSTSHTTQPPAAQDTGRVFRGRHSRQTSAVGCTGDPVDVTLALTSEEIAESFSAAFGSSILSNPP